MFDTTAGGDRTVYREAIEWKTIWSPKEDEKEEDWKGDLFHPSTQCIYRTAIQRPQRNRTTQSQFSSTQNTSMSKKATGNSLESQLQQDFCRELNEEFYQKSLQVILSMDIEIFTFWRQSSIDDMQSVEVAVEGMGAEKFRQRLGQLLLECPTQWISDEQAQSKIFDAKW